LRRRCASRKFGVAVFAPQRDGKDALASLFFDRDMLSITW